VKAQLLAAAHMQLIGSEVFIPLGAPVRWSLVRGNITGFEENRWGLHPLFPLSQPPT
jgi:oligopeptide transport system substrate-binding protein